MIYFLKPFVKHENSENRFWEFSLSWKTLLHSFSRLINSFIINDVYKNLKENVNMKVKNKHKVVIRTFYWKKWRIDSSSFFRIMNKKDFNFWCNYKIWSVRSSEQVCKVVSALAFLKKITGIWKQPLGAVL